MVKKILSKNYKRIEKLLLEEKERFETNLKSLDHTDAETGRKVPYFGEDIGDLEVEADQIEQMGNLFAIKNVLEKQLEQINSALQKIKDGTYGKCENCARPILTKQLRINPEAKYCKDCLKKQNFG